MKRLLELCLMPALVVVLFVASGLRLDYTPAAAYDVSQGYAGSKLRVSPTVVLVAPDGTMVSASSPLSMSGSVQSSFGAYTDRSGTITAGGTSQTLMAANASRKKLLIQNPPTATENLYFNFTAAASSAASSVALVPGAEYEESGNAVTTEAVNVEAATTGHVFVAKEM